MNKKRVFKILKWFFWHFLLGIIVLISASVYYFKDEIIGIVLEEVNAHLKAKVKVEKVDLAFWSSFPNLSVDFNKVFIKDSYEEATEKDTLFYSDKIRLKFNPLDIWRENYKLKQIEVLPGTLQLKIDKNGKNNFDIFKETADTVETACCFRLAKIIHQQPPFFV
ncbi:MAG: AsmA family protein [Crocinitomicaceae bacterium]